MCVIINSISNVSSEYFFVFSTYQKYNHSQRNHWLLLISGYVIQEDPPDISPGIFKPLIGKGHPEFSIRSQQIDNIGEDCLLYLDIFPVLSDAQDSTGTTRRVCQIHKWV